MQPLLIRARGLMMSNDFKLLPEVNRTFTTQEIAIACNCTLPTVRGFADKYGYEPLQVLKCDEGKKAIWDYVFYKAFKDYMQLSIAKRKEMNKKAKETTPEPTNLEELKKLHPHVTDIRCFNLNFWPDTIPENLKEYTD